MASGRSCGSAGRGVDDDGTLPRFRVLSLDDAPTPVLKDESKFPVPEKDQRAHFKIIEDDIYGWGYLDEEEDDEVDEGNEKADMEAWAKCDDFFYTTILPKKCSLCEGDHRTHECNYMVRIPPGTKIADTEDYVILCSCGGLSEDGGICNNTHCVSRGLSEDGGISRPWPPRWVIPRDFL